ncbi:hypothetical protein PDJAM_G00241290 [Pangasius djambal]|uniref:Uncharacterized protein n=1 Tax=Pangasius djambal TaxID=1691987 RepID=A0ACC5YGR8_9TELE|nr:hypothetical protein [Pangasius djambal]
MWENAKGVEFGFSTLPALQCGSQSSHRKCALSHSSALCSSPTFHQSAWNLKLQEAASFPAPMEGDGMDKLERMASVCEFDPITGNIPATKVEISVSCRYVKP